MDGGCGLGLDADGNVYVTGWSTGAGTQEDYATLKYDQGGHLVWERRLNGPASWSDSVAAIQVDAVGHVYVTGRTLSWATGLDLSTLKYDTDGTLLWQRDYDGLDSRVNDLQLDAAGNAFVTGQGFTLKYDTDGNLMWMMPYTGPIGNTTDAFEALGIDAHGNVYAAGYAYSTTWDWDCVVVKYDTGGTLVWERFYNGPANDEDAAWALALDTSGNVLVAGHSNGIGSARDCIVLKYSPDGNLLWEKRYDGPGGQSDNAVAIHVDANSNVYITGHSYVINASYDYITIKYDADGNVLWERLYNGLANGLDEAWALTVDDSDYVLVAGESVGIGTGRDGVTLRYDQSGYLVWEHRYDGPAHQTDQILAIRADAQGGIYIAGKSKGVGTDYDFVTIKYNPAIAQGMFRAPLRYAAGDEPFSLFCSDFDGDDHLDVSVANLASGTIAILRNRGDGTFNPPALIGAFAAPQSVSGCDLDGDSDCDLIVAKRNSNVVSVFKNYSGAFSAGVDYAAGHSPVSVIGCDLDGDGDRDVATTSGDYTSGYAAILKNNGDGTLQPVVHYTAGWAPFCIASGDLDGDNDLDLVVANSGSDDISILDNNGDGTFQPAVNYAAGWMPHSIAISDLDGDGDQDLAVANWADNDVSIYTNYGDGTFAPAYDYAASHGANAVTAVDLDGDGDRDLAVVAYHTDHVCILQNNGNATFQPAVYYLTGDGPNAVASGDFDGDGDPDLAIANGLSDDVTILMNNLVLSCMETRGGDVDMSGTVNAGDAIYLVNYTFKSGLQPLPCEAAGDVDCSGSVTSADIIALINYTFKGGAKPCDICGLVEDGTWTCP